ncbi:MAG: YncE family protein [Acidobacteriaceae bacterium]
MRRFVFLLVLCALSLPVGLSVTGCNINYGQNFCSGFQSGPLVSATAYITLEPKTYGISLDFGQIAPVQSPTGYNCKSLPSGLTKFTYGTSNLLLADISPSGQLCGGTWNRNSGNGIADFTSCVPTNKTGIAYITASGGGAVSNPVPVFVHPTVSGVVLGGNSAVHNCPNNPANGEPSPTVVGNYQPNTCLSQNQVAQLQATVYSNSQDITCAAGHLIYTPQDSNIVSVDQNGVATAHQPGSTVLTATIAQATSTAGFFFTCPPKSIQLTVGGTNSTSITVNQNNLQPLSAVVTDTLNNPITGLALTYSSTTPINIPVSTTGGVLPAFPSDAAIVAQCLPGICNPSAQNEIGNLSTGTPITSNPVQIHTPGPSSTFLYMSSPDSYNFVPIDFQSGTVGTPTRLPYEPNSMVMDENGNFLYFGSPNALMIVSISTISGASLMSETPGVPGTVLAVSPDNETVVVHDPCRQLFYLYTPSQGKIGATETSFAAQGPTIACNVDNAPLDPSVEVNPPYSASFTQDSQTLYIAGENILYVYSRFTGWHVCTDNGNDPAGNCPIGSTSTAITVPGVGVYTGGQQTRAFGYCPTGPNQASQNAGNPPTTPPTTGVNPNNALNPTNYYPPAETGLPATDQLAATTDGKHIIGATAASSTLTDFDVTIPNGACPLHGALQFTSTANQLSLATPNIGTINQVLVSPNSQIGFVTFIPANTTGSNNTLPAYKIPATGPGQVVNVPLTGQAGAPIAGVFSPDTNTFYVSTTGDDLIHFIDTANVNALTDTQQVNPRLTCDVTTTAPANPFLACTQGKPIPALFLAARPRPIQ